ncbi:hypothetical protein C7M84_007300 [Penaeus vannamei]|uniref:Uncharacterized protein n=1 Tax=Penaeus vannamei TaxID=6689 RepID=A0A3R7STE1_PENVA|nr:hypothetical protein C7M84_007300 [Penaeus vannamei]
MYPDWVVWLYTNPRGREDVLCPLLRDFPHLYICDVTNLPSLGNVTSIHNMVWRALPLGDERVSAFFVRDSDSILLERGAAAVREWMAGNKSFHLLRDHPYHGIPIMGGLWAPAGTSRRPLSHISPYTHSSQRTHLLPSPSSLPLPRHTRGSFCPRPPPPDIPPDPLSPSPKFPPPTSPTPVHNLNTRWLSRDSSTLIYLPDMYPPCGLIALRSPFPS